MKKGEIIGRLLKDGQITEEEAVALLTGKDVDAPVSYPALPYWPYYPTYPYWSIYPYNPYGTSAWPDGTNISIGGDIQTTTVTYPPDTPFTLTGGTT